MAKESVLVVEDEEDIRELLKYNLEKEGFRFSGRPREKQPCRPSETACQILSYWI